MKHSGNVRNGSEADVATCFCYSPTMQETLLNIPSAIAGSSITLRRFEAGDAHELLSALNETRADLQRWSGLGEHDTTLSEVVVRLAAMELAFDQRKRLAFAILDDEGRFSGSCALERIDWHARTFQLGYWLRTSGRGRGLVSEAVRTMTRYAFSDLAAIRVSIWTDERNGRSANVATRVGFLREGLLRNERLDADGCPQNTLVFARIDTQGM